MCVIIYKPEDVEIDPEVLDKCERTFGDGLGFTFFDKKKKEPRVYKHHRDIERVRNLYDKHVAGKGFEAIVHFRVCSAGIVNLANTQPLTSNRYVFAHNGTIFHMKSLQQKNESDTAALGRLILDTVNPNRKGHKIMLEHYLDGDRFIMMNKKTGEIHILNEGQGMWIDGLWFSNDRWTKRYNWKNWSYISGYDDDDVIVPPSRSVVSSPSTKAGGASRIGRASTDVKWKIPYNQNDLEMSYWVFSDYKMYSHIKNDFVYWWDFPNRIVVERIEAWLVERGIDPTDGKKSLGKGKPRAKIGHHISTENSRKDGSNDCVNIWRSYSSTYCFGECYTCKQEVVMNNDEDCATCTALKKFHSKENQC